jgi:hypothetical protein
MSTVDVLGGFLDGRGGMSAQMPQALVAKLMEHVRTQFYGDQEKRFYQEQRELMGVLTWPAAWLRERRITLPMARYEAILRGVILEMQRHGDTGKVRHFPSYFARCVRLWFVHNGEALYMERKSLRDALPNMRELLARTGAKEADPVEALAAAHAVLATRKAGPKTARKDASKDDSQSTLFDV